MAQRSADAAGTDEQHAQDPLIALQAVFLHVLSLLPADQRLRAAFVSRGWRANVALPALWAGRLDLSPTSGVVQRASLALLFRACVAKAGGALTAIDVSGTDVPTADLLAALRASRAVTEAHTGRALDFASVTALLDAAPSLRHLHAGVFDCTPAQAATLLAARGPYALLRLEALSVSGARNAPLPHAITAALANAALHTGLAQLHLSMLVLRVAHMEALADAVCARPRLSRLHLVHCTVPAAAAGAVARAIRDGALTTLTVYGEHVGCFNNAGAAVLADALRANGTLTALSLTDVPSLSAPAAAALLGALAGHRSVRTLRLCSNRGGHEPAVASSAAAGAALAARIVAADAPSLTQLDVSGCFLGEEGLAPLLDALQRNSHLQTLRADNNGRVAPGFMRRCVLPSVRGNNGALRSLSLQRLAVQRTNDSEEADRREGAEDAAVLEEAMRILAARPR
jgi:hypothetical protein